MRSSRIASIAAHAGVLVTRIASSDGHRLGTWVVDTRSEAELHALRATVEGFALVGRVRSEVRPDGTGWDAFAANVATDGTAASYRVLDFDRGDVLFDIAQLPGGRFLALGTTGYVQNPNGASVSEDAQPLLALLDVKGEPSWTGEGSRVLLCTKAITSITLSTARLIS